MIFNSLYSAVIESDLPRVQLLLEHGADPDLGYDDITPLMQASSCQSLSIMQKLIDTGADVNRRDKMGRTALMQALNVHAEFPLLVIDDWIRQAHTKRYLKELCLPVTSLLISSDAEYEEADNNGFFPTDYALLAFLNGVELPLELKPDQLCVKLCRAAIADSFSELASILASEHIFVRIITMALHLAALRGYPQCCSALLKYGADANGVDIFGNHPIESAAAGLHAPVVSLLVEHGVTPEGLNRALLAACMAESHRWPEKERSYVAGRRFELARYLLEQGANPNFKHENHDAPLKQAIVREEDYELVRLLLEYEADPTAKDEQGEIPSAYVITKRLKEILKHGRLQHV